SEVKRKRADGSVGSPHVRVGHRQAPNYLIEMQPSQLNKLAFLLMQFVNWTDFPAFLSVLHPAIFSSMSCNPRF
ncbi:hypothetical protein, partial [Shewanella oncorhynchi]|uniref:hypothetical protein n=1 Tax=Shewanella oncorhynchi TaxID=2726434 RepID=UPI003D796BF2